ncbi:MAG: NTP transferase domain-containing protein [Pseudomonadales bacterium]|nr:NTP transferase domain-containing protein [Pseudomonadales bacterium]
MKNNKRLWGLIPAAGKGQRARPYTREVHKGLLDINGKPTIVRIIDIMRDDMGISDIVIVLGYLGDSIRETLGDGQKFGVRLHYIENNNLERGLAWSIALSAKRFEGFCCVMLCDECYIHSNHSELASSFPYEQYYASCAGLQVEDENLIQKNYAIEYQGNRINALHEKPKTLTNDIMGSGTFILSPEFFVDLELAFADNNFGYIEFVDFIDTQIGQQKIVGYFPLIGTYININDRDSLHLAKYHDRIKNFSHQKISLLIYAEGDEKNIAFTLSRYRELGIFHEMVLVLGKTHSYKEGENDNLPLLRIIRCSADINGYGEKIHHALKQLEGDIFIITEADYSFSNRDISKLLSYLPEADMVIGTRTTRQLIEQGSSMQGIVRIAHAFLGYLMELLWWNRECRFTDAGCTFRAIWRTSFQLIEKNLHEKGPAYSAEMMIELIEQRQRVIEIPVNYYNRSASQQQHHRNPRTFFSFLKLILRKRLDLFFR